MRRGVVIGAVVIVLLLIGIVIPKLTVHDLVPASASLDQCVRLAVEKSYGNPLERAALALGQTRIVSVTAGDAQAESFTIFRIPMGVVTGQPAMQISVFCDPASLSPISILPESNYKVENGAVYYVTLLHTMNGTRVDQHEIAGADPATFVSLGSDWGKDAKHVFYEGGLAVPLSSSTPVIHPASFEAMPDTFYAKDDQAVYFPTLVYHSDGSGQWEYDVLPGADPATFTIVLPLQYAKDKTHVWYIGQGEGGPAREILHVDAATFRVIGECGSGDGASAYYAADAHSVIAMDQIVPGADPSTFTIVGATTSAPGMMPWSQTYAVDKHHVYEGCGEIVPGADPAKCTPENLSGCEAQ